MIYFLILILSLLVGWLLFSIQKLRDKFTAIEHRLWNLERISRHLLHQDEQPAPKHETSPAPAAPAVPAPSLSTSTTPPPAPPAEPTAEPTASVKPIVPAPPVLPASPPQSHVPAPAFTPGLPSPTPGGNAWLRPVARKPINWEQFLGVKLFAWIGGFILFLGMAFFVKHAFDNNLISPAVRVVIGYAVGLGLVIGGHFVSRERNPVTVQTLCASGILILYATIYASHAYYQQIDLATAFIQMTMVTGAAFVLAIRLEAQVVAVLGWVGGFLTPVLLSRGEDHPFLLFGYVAMLDVGLLGVATRKRWNYLTLLAALGTVTMQVAWSGQFFTAEKIYVAMGIFLFFALLFVAALALAHRATAADQWNEVAALIPPGIALAFAGYLLVSPYTEIAQSVGLMFGFVFLVDLGFLAIAWLRDNLRPAQLAAGGGVFLLLMIWTIRYLTPQTLLPALGCFLLFALLHSLAPVVLQKLRPAPTPLWWAHGYPLLALLLILVPFFKLETTSLLIWPVVLMIDLVAFGLALLTSSLVSVLAVFLLTMLVTGLWIIQVPPELAEVPALLAVIGGFAIFFTVAGIWVARLLVARKAADGEASLRGPDLGMANVPPQMFAQMAAMGAMLPFLLLTLVVLRLPMANPSAVFGLAAGLVVLFLGVVRLYRVDALAAVGMASVLLLEYVWHLQRFDPDQIGLALAWHLGFGALFFVFPFLFREKLQARWLPWTVSALALPAHFYLLHHSAKQAWPAADYPGVLPALLAVPCLLGLVHLIKKLPQALTTRNTLLALFGGATLFFITLVFPVQFDHEWLTIGWALEGVALLWLLHRVPHPGLKWVGVVLLTVAFARLALNPAVLDYHARSGQPIFNWFLYTYGIVAGCLMVGARLLAPPRHRLENVNVPPWLWGMGTVLAFLLLNIEIADFFSTGTHLTFRFSGNLGQDMTYSLAWGLFAFGLLAVGFLINNAAARYSGMGLLVATIIKIFLHDLWRLGGMYRVGSLIGLAVVLIVVSFIYQRFLSSTGAGATVVMEPDQSRQIP